MNNWIVKTQLLVLFIAIMSISCVAQKPKNLDIVDLFTVDQLKKDLKVLKSELEDKHPGLYAYCAKDQIDSVFFDIEKSLQVESTAIEFYRKIAVLNSVIKDVHTKVVAPESYRVARETTLGRFPFAVHVEDGKVFVLRNLSNNQKILTGWEILEINGVRIEDVLSEILKTITRDGHNKTGPEEKLNLFFSGLYATVIGTPVKYEIIFRDLQEKEIQASVESLVHKEVLSNYESRYDVPTNITSKPITYEFKDDVSILTITSFEGGNIKDAGQAYKKEFKNAFSELKSRNTKYLIIDVRFNRGGWNEVGDELLSYLIDVPFRHYKRDYSITNVIENKDLYLQNGYIKHFENLNFEKTDEGYNIIWNEKEVQPKRNIYKGKIMVLINGQSASQTGTFSGLLKEHTRAIFIGEETGGNPHKICGGDMLTLVLPNTKVMMEIPLRRIITKVNFDAKGRGVLPDYVIKPSLLDRVNKFDNVMELTMNLIAK